MGLSRLEQLAKQTKRTRTRFLKRLTPAELEAVATMPWEFIARPEQLAPAGNWVHWWVVAGRGYGKTRSGSEFIHKRARDSAMRHGALVGPTAGDVRDIMVEGASGILATARKGELPKYEPSKRRLTWPNGATCTTYSAEEPERLRGPEHDTWWCDEPGVWRYGPATRDNLAFGARVGNPRGVWTTTPRNVTLVREALAEAEAQRKSCAEDGGYWVRDPQARGGQSWRAEPMTRVTKGTTYENLHNLADAFANEVLTRYEGTRLGEQELLAKLLDDLGLFFQRGWFTYLEADDPDPAGLQLVRYWDLAGSVETEGNPDPDWTVGVKVGMRSTGGYGREYVVLDVVRDRLMPGGVEKLVRATAVEDGVRVTVGIEQEPGQSGKSQYTHYRTRVLPGFNVKALRPTGPKEARASLPAGYAEQGNVRMRRAGWNAGLLDELEEFNNGAHDDQVDALSGAFELLEPETQASVSGSKVARTQLPKPALVRTR